jgi:hypothetical protein
MDIGDEFYVTMMKWPDGTEQIVFPRPGKNPIPTSLATAVDDFDKAVLDMLEYNNKQSHLATLRDMTGVTLTLLRVQCVDVLNRTYTNDPSRGGFAA